MTFKEKYNSIDQSKLPENAKAFMAGLKEDTANFTNKEIMAKIMPALDRFIDKLKESGYGDAIKGAPKKETKKAETPTEKAKEIVEKAVEQPETKTGKPKVGKISKGDFMKIAKEIRKEGEPWNDAMKRAGDIIRTQKEVVKKEATRQYEKLKKFIEKHPEVYPMDIPVQGGGFRKTTVNRDAPRVALAKGKRVSKAGWKNQYGKSDGGKTYYEYRSNRYDTRRQRYPFLEKGGEVEGHKHVLHIDGQNWFLEKIDSTHFYMSNDRNHRGMAHHIGQHKGEPYYEEVREWLKTTYAKGGELDMNKYAGAGMFAHGGIVKNIRENIKLINSRLKSLEETNTEEAYQRSEMLRKQKANLEALLLTYEDNPEYESRSIGATYYARGGYMSKGELVWNKLSSAKRHDFLHKHFHPEMTPRSIEILVNKSYNFLPKKIKIKMESVYANVEEYAKGGEIEYGSMVLKHDFPKYKRKPATTVYLKPDTSKIVKIGGLGEKGYNLLYKDGNNSNLVIKQTDLDKLKNGEIIESSGAVVSLSDKYAEGGYIAMGENYEYTNYFGIEQDDFENIVEIWHKWENISENNPNFNSVKEEYLSMLKSMESKYGADKFNKVLDYIEETHLSHREEEVKSDLIDEINDMNQESFMNLCDNMGFEPNDWELFVNAMDYNNAEELLNDIRNGDYEVSEYDADEYAKGGVIGNFRIVPYKRIEVKNNPDLIEPYYSLAFTINGTLSEAEQEAQEYVKRNSPEIVSATITKIHPSGQPLKNKKVANVTKDEISKYAKGGEISDVKIGDILIASTGVKVKVVDYDSMFGGRVKAVRLDEYATGKPSQWMPVTNFKKFAKGGSISKRTTYVPNRDVKELMVVLKGELTKLKGKDILDGVYVKNNRKPVGNKNAAKELLALFKKEAEKDPYGAEVGIDISDIEKLFGAGLSEQDVKNIFLGYSPSSVKADTEFGSTTSGLIGYTGESQKDKIDEIVTTIEDGYYEIGLKYPEGFDWKAIINKYKISKTPKTIEIKTPQRAKRFEIYLGEGVVVGHLKSYKYKGDDEWTQEFTYGELDSKNPKFETGYWGIVTKKKEDMYYIIDTLLKQSKGYVKDVVLFNNSLGGIGANDVVNEKFAKGGRVEVVLNEGNGKVLNDIYNMWNNVKTEQQYKKWVEKVRNTKFGTYGTLSFEEVMKKFDFDNAPINSFHLKTFKQELKNALSNTKYAKGGKIGFKGLSEKVAKYYANKSVPSEYRSLYGKKYDKAEAKEVGDKVAAKVYRQQQSKKK